MHDGNIQNEADKFQQADLVVFNLHGFPNSNVWTGGDGKDDGIPALRASTLSLLDLRNTGVFAINCYLGDSNAPMRTALFSAGAEWVIAGEGKNIAGVRRPGGADLLLKHFVALYERLTFIRPRPGTLLKFAKSITATSAPKNHSKQRAALKDTLAFSIFYQGVVP